MHIIGQIADALLEFAEENLYLGLLILITVEEAGVPLPLPGDTLLLLAGYQMSQGRAEFPIILGIILVATWIGASILFWISRRAGRALVYRFVYRYGRYVHLSVERLDQVEHWLQRHRGAAIMIGRLVPGLRVATTVACGVFGVSYRDYITYTTIATVIWTIVYVLLGELIGTHLEVLKEIVVSNPIAIAVFVFMVIATIWFLRRRSARPARVVEAVAMSEPHPVVEPGERRD